ncbi:hypothetical protein GGR57DRAFT_458594 [Xylariaceae sp. FL1272]|nr:hypothetical protein GGR57DRAFT_458594 [Xylariaceae sp. FL1272]
MEAVGASSDGNGATGGSRKLAAKLIPQKLVAKRRWKKQASNESFGSTTSSIDEYPRGRSPGSRRPGSMSTTQSSEVAEEDGEDAHGEGPEDIEDDGDASRDTPKHESPSRPGAPSTHPSQIGHLTTSSPIIQSDHLTAVHPLDQQDVVKSISPALDPALPLSAKSSKSTLHPPSESSSRRSKSPAGRFRDAFRAKKTARTTASSDSLDQEASAAASDQPPKDPSSRRGSVALSQSDAGAAGIVSNDRDRSRRKNSIPPLALSARPQTPPSSNTGPVIVNTPPTPTDTTTSRDSPVKINNPNVVVSPSGNMISHRRARSGSAASIGPSKLSNIVSAPLTPTPENAVAPTPGGGGFFSSVLSAAQNAATSLSTTITNTSINPNPNRPKTSGSRDSAPISNESIVEGGAPSETSKDINMGGKEPAVKTLGMGDLSLSQLGIQEAASASTTPITSKFHDAESRTRSESAPTDVDSSNTHGDGQSDDLTIGRPKSLYEPANTTPPASVYESGGGVHRSSSIRSAISKRRKRGSTGGTANTGTTIGAAIAAATASVAHPSAAGSTPKFTGFAVASKKRNRDFHTFFKSVPDDDYLIEDYSCALQREILAHGRLYVSEGHICFSSNILGWVTTLVISFDEVVSVEKRSTALVFKNGLMISTLHAKHVFASFASRDSTYDLIVNIWKLGHPSLRSSLNGVSLDETGGDKTEKIDGGDGEGGSQTGGSVLSQDEDSDEDDDDDIYDEDLEDDDIPNETQPIEMSTHETDGEKIVSRKVSSGTVLNGAADKADGAPSSGAVDFPGPATHGPTDCGDADTHFEVPIGDDIIGAPLGKVYNLMFGPASVTWMSKWLANEQKCTDLQMDDKKGLTQDNKSRQYTYIKPLYAPIGPKSTKCIVTETIENMDLEKAVNVLVVTQTPDVPSGNVFSVKTKYCLFWAENNATRVTMNCTIEWTGKSWLKGPIEKGAKDGQATYWKDLYASIKASVTTRARAGTATGVGKGKKKRAKGKLNGVSKEDSRDPTAAASSKTQDWGLFEPLHGLLGPVFDVLKPVMTGNVVYGLLVGLLVATWFGFGLNGQRGGGYGRDMAFAGYPDRAVAYEEIWRREESDLWDWLEERVGLHRMNEGAMPIRKRVMEPRVAEEKLREERMNEREIEEAIRITEQKLNVLKSVIDRKKEGKNGRSNTEAPTER